MASVFPNAIENCFWYLMYSRFLSTDIGLHLPVQKIASLSILQTYITWALSKQTVYQQIHPFQFIFAIAQWSLPYNINYQGNIIKCKDGLWEIMLRYKYQTIINKIWPHP